MPKRTGFKSNQEQQRLQQDDIKTRHLKNQIAQVNLQENHNNHNKDSEFHHDDSKYIIKRHIIQHHQSIIVPNPNMYYYQPYYNPSFMQQPPQNSRDILQQLTVENVKRVVREKQLSYYPFQQIHNTVTSMIEYEHQKDAKGRSSSNREHKKNDADDNDEIIIEGIRILNGPQPKAGNVRNVNSINISVTPERLQNRHSKNVNVTVIKHKGHTEKPHSNNTTAATNSTVQPTATKDEPLPEEEYEYEDEDENFELEDETKPQGNAPSVKPAGPYNNKQEEELEDKRWNLGTLGFNFNRSKDNTGDGIFVQQLKVRRGGVAIAGPGGIATAGSGGTAIVGPGGFAYTHPGSVAIAGSGSQVVAVDPDVSLSDIVNNNNKRNRTRPGGLFGNRPHRPRIGRVVAVGPVIYYNRG